MARLLCMLGLVLAPCTAWACSDTPAEQENAIKAIQKVATKVVRDEKLPGKPVIELLLQGQDVTDATLVHVKHLPDLKLLDLTLAKITDDGLQNLKGLSKLEVLVLTFTPVTDKGLVHLKNLTKLRRLSLFVTKVTGKGLVHLKDLTQLRELYLDREHDMEKEIVELCEALPRLKVDRGNGNSAEKRVRKHFAIAESEVVNQKTIRSAILAKLPVGSSEEQVKSFLKKSGIGEDNLSAYYPLEKGRITCRIEFDPNSGWIVHKHYGIFFMMDEKKCLKEVSIEVWFTGP
jgi:hypothetical protein